MYASGPGLKQNYISKPLMMTDHYNLICHLLNIEAQPNNGSWLRVQGMIADSSSIPLDMHFCGNGSHSSLLVSDFTLFGLLVLIIKDTLFGATMS